MIRKHSKRLAAARHSKWTQKLKIDGALLSINRRSVARAVFFGVFFALLPMPFQFAMVIGVSFFLKFNLPIAFALIWLTNPLTMPFILYIEYQVGAFILGTADIPGIEFTLAWMQEHLDEIFFPLFFGAFLMAALSAALLSYMVSLFWIYSVRKEYAAK